MPTPAPNARSLVDAAIEGGEADVAGVRVNVRRFLAGVLLVLALSYEFGFHTSRWRAAVKDEAQLAHSTAPLHAQADQSRVQLTGCGRRTKVANLGYYAASPCSFNITRLVDWAVIRLYYAERRARKAREPCTFLGVGATASDTVDGFDRFFHRDLAAGGFSRKRATRHHEERLHEMAREYATRFADTVDVDDCLSMVYTWSGEQQTIVEQELDRLGEAGDAPKGLSRRVAVRGVLGSLLHEADRVVTNLEDAAQAAAAAERDAALAREVVQRRDGPPAPPAPPDANARAAAVRAAEDRLALLRMGANASFSQLEHDVKQRLNLVIGGPGNDRADAAGLVFKVAPSVQTTEMIASLGKAASAPVTRLIVWTHVVSPVYANDTTIKTAVDYFGANGFAVYVVGANSALDIRKGGDALETRVSKLTFLRIDGGFYHDLYDGMSSDMVFTYAAVRRTDPFYAHIQRTAVTCVEGADATSFRARQAWYTGARAGAAARGGCKCRLEELNVDRETCDAVRALAGDAIRESANKLARRK